MQWFTKGYVIVEPTSQDFIIDSRSLQGKEKALARWCLNKKISEALSHKSAN